MPPTNPRQKVKLETNVPLILDQIESLRVLPNNPAHNYGPQVVIEGVSQSKPVVCYLPGKTWAVLAELQKGGLIGPYPDEAVEPTERFTCSILHPKGWTLTWTKRGDDQYPWLDVKRSNGAPPRQTAREIGGPLPGEYDNEGPPQEAPRESIINAIQARIDLQRTLLESQVEIIETIAKRLLAQDIPVQVTIDLNAIASVPFISLDKAGRLP